MTNRIQARMEQAAIAMTNAIIKLKADWLDKQIQRIMPPEIYDLAQTTVVAKGHQARNRMKLTQWMAKNKVVLLENVKEEGDSPVIKMGEIPQTLPPSVTRTRLMRGDSPISDFCVRYQNGKCETMVKNYPVDEETSPA